MGGCRQGSLSWSRTCLPAVQDEEDGGRRWCLSGVECASRNKESTGRFKVTSVAAE